MLAAALIGVGAIAALLAALWITLQSQLGTAAASLVIGCLGLIIAGGLLWLAAKTAKPTK